MENFTIGTRVARRNGEIGFITDIHEIDGRGLRYSVEFPDGLRNMSERRGWSYPNGSFVPPLRAILPSSMLRIANA